jgi:Ca2+:H+ antiporter
MPRWLYALLVFSILAPILNFLPVPPVITFIVAGLGILPLAALIGLSIEQIAEHTGERIGGLLFATFGNATELIIGIFALTEGLVDVVRASIIGSILGNALLVLGVAVCVGGFKHGRLRFETQHVTQYSSLLALSIGGLVLPTVAELLAVRAHQTQIAQRGVLLSDFIAIVLLLGYLASILFSVFRIRDKDVEDELDPVLGARSSVAIARLLSYRHHVAGSNERGKSGVLRQIDETVETITRHESGQGTAQQAQGNQMVAQEAGKQEHDEEKADGVRVANQKRGKPQDHNVEVSPKSSQDDAQPQAQHGKSSFPWLALVMLAVVTAAVAWLSDILVGAIEPVTKVLGWNPAFVGLVFIPLVGGLPEYFNTITMALDKRIGMVLAASAGSSIQIALLMAPILVLVSLFMPQRLDLVFSIIELAVLGLATYLFSEITKDGELVWLEGVLLILLYGMMGVTVFIFGA